MFDPIRMYRYPDFGQPFTLPFFRDFSPTSGKARTGCDMIRDRIAARGAAWPPSDPASHMVRPGTIHLEGRTYIGLGLNDYLGLASDPRVIAAAQAALATFGAGARASRHIGGDTAVHRELEEELADLKSAESALLFASGYAANLGVVSALPGRGDTVCSDELNHASIIDGARLSSAEVKVYRHSDVENLGRQLDQASGATVIVTDSVFSMNGDLAPVDEIADLADAHDSVLVLDDAHATGVLGSGGKGSTGHYRRADRADVIVGTLGKALGSVGAFATGSAELIGYLSEVCRTFLFTTAPSPAAAAAALEALRIMRSEPERVERLWENAATINSSLSRLGFSVPEKVHPIIPVMLRDAAKAETTEAVLHDHGISARAILPPYVPAGTSRIRLIASAVHTDEQMERLQTAFGDVARRLNLSG